MKTHIFLRGTCALALALAAVGPAHAMAPGTLSAKEHTTYALGADLIGQLPVGNFADVVGFGLGALARLEYNLDQSPLAVTARAGYVWHGEKENDQGAVTTTTNFSQIPLLAGLKYSLTGAPIYIAAEAGAVIAKSEGEVDGPGPGTTSFDESETNFAWSAGAGYELGPVDIRLALYFPDASNMGDMMTVGISLGYNFWGM
jgi:opacity protein-like surface antigen